MQYIVYKSKWTICGAACSFSHLHNTNQLSVSMYINTERYRKSRLPLFVVRSSRYTRNTPRPKNKCNIRTNAWRINWRLVVVFVLWGYLRGGRVVLSPHTDIFIEMVRTQDGRVPRKVVEVVHDDRNEQVQHLTEGPQRSVPACACMCVCVHVCARVYVCTNAGIFDVGMPSISPHL